MKLTTILVPLATLAAAGFCMTYVHGTKRPTHSEAPTITSATPDAPATPAPAPPGFRIIDESRAGELAAEVVRSTAKPPLGPNPRKVGQASSQKPRTPKQKPPLQAPEARFALSYVGEDEFAEEIWNEAINDPSLSAHERQDLIEDLNEDGFADPHHVTLDDLPLILRRLALIEEMAPNAMDEVNAEAFREAYKDLMNMVAGLAEQ